MSKKRDNDGDVIANRLSLVEAKGQRLLASMFGSLPEPKETNNGAKSTIDEDEDLKQDFGHDRLGVGAIAPKEIEEGSFTRRIPTSNDKLLEQLIGKKRAKAHMAAQKEAMRPTKAQKYGKAKPVQKEESDDEEGGRAAIFKSKRRRLSASEPKETGAEKDVGGEEQRRKPVELEETQPDANGTSSKTLNGIGLSETDKASEATNTSTTIPRRAKAKPKSYLDEILAERSKKKNKKNKA